MRAGTKVVIMWSKNVDDVSCHVDNMMLSKESYINDYVNGDDLFSIWISQQPFLSNTVYFALHSLILRVRTWILYTMKWLYLWNVKKYYFSLQQQLYPLSDYAQPLLATSVFDLHWVSWSLTLSSNFHSFLNYFPSAFFYMSEYMHLLLSLTFI